MDDKVTLLPCPFCGGKASASGKTHFTLKEPDAWWNDGTPIIDAFFCNCTRCGITNQTIVGGYQTQAMAIAEWNRRQAQEAPKAVSKIFCDRCGEVCKPQSNWGNCTLCGDNICENCIPQGFDDNGCCGTCGEQHNKEAPKVESVSHPCTHGLRAVCEFCSIDCENRAPKAESACEGCDSYPEACDRCDHPMPTAPKAASVQSGKEMSDEEFLATVLKRMDVAISNHQSELMYCDDMRALLKDRVAQRQAGREEAEADKKRYEVFAESRIAKIGSDIEVLNARYAEVVEALKEARYAIGRVAMKEPVAVQLTMDHIDNALEALSDLDEAT